MIIILLIITYNNLFEIPYLRQGVHVNWQPRIGLNLINCFDLIPNRTFCHCGVTV